MSTQLDRSAKLGNPKKTAFLAAYRMRGSITRAAKDVGIDRDNHYLWLYEDPEYAEEFARSRLIAGEVIEEEAVLRATREENPSDTLLIFILKGLKPNVYREYFKHEMTGANGGPIQTTAMDLSKLNDAQLAMLEELAIAAHGPAPEVSEAT